MSHLLGVTQVVSHKLCHICCVSHNPKHPRLLLSHPSRRTNVQQRDPVVDLKPKVWAGCSYCSGKLYMDIKWGGKFRFQTSRLIWPMTSKNSVTRHILIAFVAVLLQYYCSTIAVLLQYYCNASSATVIFTSLVSYLANSIELCELGGMQGPVEWQSWRRRNHDDVARILQLKCVATTQMQLKCVARVLQPLRCCFRNSHRAAHHLHSQVIHDTLQEFVTPHCCRTPVGESFQTREFIFAF